MPSAGVSHVIIAVIAGGLWSGYLVTTVQGKPMQVKPGCRYEGRRYQEGAVVLTSEPCLQCNCVEASLRCRLRVCPRIPNPPPPECHLRISSEHVCCPEMICGGSSYNGENSLRRMDLGSDDILDEDGCLFEGVRYADGSAMMATRRCEYCYCILGSRRCVRPKCLLPLPGCAPLYAPHSCCPVAYNCTNDKDGNGSTTIPSLSSNGCRVGNRYYKEGEMVRDIAWKAQCDNCFCAMGAVRCVPLACSPPLQGCSPIVREGQCCPSTYNCSGSIEVKATQNYASYAFVSKDYANFRKETHFYPIENQVNAILSNAIVEGRGHRIIDTMVQTTGPEIIDVTALESADGQVDSTSFSSTGSTEVLSSKPASTETETIGNEIFSETTEFQTSTSFTTPSFTTEITTNAESTATTSFESSTSPYDPTTTTSVPEETTSWIEASSTTIAGDVLEERFDGLANEKDDTGITEGANRITAVSSSSTATTNETISSTDRLEITVENSSTVTTGSPTTVLTSDDIFAMNVTLKTNVSVGLVEGVTITPMRSIPPDVEAILNITQRDKAEDYDYYSVPTLPPSLPNVRIIPFVAADALDTASSVTAYPSASAGAIPELQHSPTDSSNFYDIVTRENRFSPPVETEGYLGSMSLYGVQKVAHAPRVWKGGTFHAIARECATLRTLYINKLGKMELSKHVLQKVHSSRVEKSRRLHPDEVIQRWLLSNAKNFAGGFVPRDPPYFEGSYHSTDLSLEIGTSVTVVPADITNPNRKEDGIITCRFKTRQYHHAEFIPNSGLCVICICYYGEVVCSDEKCPPLKIGCRRLEADNVCCGKIVCVDTAESPTMVLDRADATTAEKRQPVSLSDGIVTQDPFRDVIKTEPAPDLPSLIEDMIPYLVERGISTPRSTTPMSTSNGIKLNSAIMNGEFETDFTKFNPQVKSPLYNDNFSKFSQIEGTKNSEFPSFANRNSSSSDNSELNLKNLNESVDHLVYDNAKNLSTTETVPPEPVVKESEFISNEKDAEDDEDSVYSFGHVFDFLFAETTTVKDTSTSKIPKEIDSSTPTTLPTSTSTSSPKPVQYFTTESTTTTTTTTVAGTNFEINVGNEGVPKVVGSLLKLAGCNIYGRMYRVGRIITELSGPCLECRCTEIGVQCKKLSC